jgi:Putative adhesin
MINNNLSKKGSLALLLSFFILHLVAQTTTLQVATKNIEKTIAYKKGYELQIEGDKADIVVSSSKKDEIKIIVELISKHPDATQAQKDLDKVTFSAEVKDKKVVVRNFNDLKKDEKLLSSVKARYLITVPESCPVFLKNSYGKTNISNIASAIDIYNEFCTIILNNLKGSANVETKFGDITGKRLDGRFKFNSRRSNITLSQLRGNYDLTANYGTLRILADIAPIGLTINGEKTDVYFTPYNKQTIYNLNANHGDIFVAKTLGFSPDGDSNKRFAYFKPANAPATVSISVNFGNIRILN